MATAEQYKFNVWNKPHHIRLDTVDNSDDSGVDNEKSPSGLKGSQMDAVGDLYKQNNDIVSRYSSQSNDTARVPSSYITQNNDSTSSHKISSFHSNNDTARVPNYVQQSSDNNSSSRLASYIQNNDISRLSSPSRDEVIDVVNDSKRENGNGDHTPLDEEYVIKASLHKPYKESPTAENGYTNGNGAHHGQDALSRFNNIHHEQDYLKNHELEDLYKKSSSELTIDYKQQQQDLHSNEGDYVNAQDAQTRQTKSTNEEDYIKSQEVHTYHGKPTHYYRDVPRSDTVLAVKV